MSSPPASIEDPERTARIRARDPDTLQGVVREHLPMLLRAARAAGLSLDQADDAVQETLLTFLTRAHEFDGRARVRTWLYGILLKKTARAFESVRRSQETEEIDEIADCLEDLPDRRRLAFVLREVEELPTEEVCKTLEVTPNNLGVLLFRARNGLRECLEFKGLRGRDDAELLKPAPTNLPTSVRSTHPRFSSSVRVKSFKAASLGSGIGVPSRMARITVLGTPDIFSAIML